MDGEQGVSLARIEKPDLILMDMSLLNPLEPKVDVADSSACRAVNRAREADCVFDTKPINWAR
jgi:hypothetical protein